jgi:secreted PhoX family phosphatase
LNQFSSPANDLLNSKRAIERINGMPNPDNVKFDKAGDMWTKKAAMRMDVIINEANGE